MKRALYSMAVGTILLTLPSCAPQPQTTSPAAATDTPSPTASTSFRPDSQKVGLSLEIEGQAEKSVSFPDLYSVGPMPELAFDDPLFGETRHYIGLSLDQLQKLAGAGPQQKVLKLHCRDGYVSEVEADVLKQGQFLLAFRDKAAAPDTFVPYERMDYLRQAPSKLESQLRDAGLSAEEKDKLTKKLDHLKTFNKDMKNLGNQGPFYPVFIASDSLPKDKAWFPPFCVDKVTFAKSKTDKSLAMVKGLPDDSPAVRGNKLFESTCSSCHKINGIGGGVGPELNRPYSVTEYWKDEYLKKLLTDPNSVREGSKMPAFHLADDKIDDILAYLKWMSGHKK